VSIFVNVLKEV